MPRGAPNPGINRDLQVQKVYALICKIGVQRCTCQRIADECGVSIATAFDYKERAVEIMKSELAKDTQEHRAQLLAFLCGVAFAEHGNTKDKLSASRQITAILGLNMPKRLEFTGSVSCPNFDNARTQKIISNPVALELQLKLEQILANKPDNIVSMNDVSTNTEEVPHS